MEKIMMKSLNQLILLIVVLVFFGCSSKENVEICEGVWKNCSFGDDCDCWKTSD